MGHDAKSHKDLIVWQKAIDLTAVVYTLTEVFPQRETYALSAQMRRAVVSIPSNITEGRSRNTRKDFSHFLRMAYGSASELETQLIICTRLSLGNRQDVQEANALLEEISKMLHAMIRKLEAKS